MRLTFLGIHPPVVVGTIQGINTEPDPLTMLVEKPLDPRVTDGVAVLVDYPLWLSVHGRWFAALIVDVELAQFRLIDADTSAEPTSFAGSASVAVAETRTYVPPVG